VRTNSAAGVTLAVHLVQTSGQVNYEELFKKLTSPNGAVKVLPGGGVVDTVRPPNTTPEVLSLLSGDRNPVLGGFNSVGEEIAFVLGLD
jgi:hypothetical protein